MSKLNIYRASNAAKLSHFDDHAAMAEQLDAVGVRFERGQIDPPVQPGASSEEVLAAYESDIARLQREDGYRAVDVISLAPNHPDRATLRRKFLEEHTHSEDEVRFFVAGRGQFTLHIGGRVYEVLCEAGDLIGVPARTRHWFDMSERPYFVAIRLFTNPEGWVANFTGDDIAARFPRMTPAAGA